MKHCFIINPAAGDGKGYDAVLPQIVSAAKQWGEDYEIHRTSGPGEAAIFARGKLETHSRESIRFYACGGDGTVSEVVNGIYGNKRAELAIIPTGSGNDYIRNFGKKSFFLDITKQLAGKAVPVDVMHYTFTAAGAQNAASFYSINMINMGFDAMVVEHMEQLKNKLFLKGTGAYVAGVIRQLATYKMSSAIFHPDNSEAIETDFLLAGVGNGQYSGGGFDGMPCALVDDGLLDLMIIEPISRRKFVRLVGAYHEGKHMQHPMFKEILHLTRVKTATIEPKTKLHFTADGEIHTTEKPLTVSVAPQKVMFVLPDGLHMERNAEKAFFDKTALRKSATD